MKKIKILFLLFIVISSLVFISQRLVFAQQPSAVVEMEDKSETLILKNGDAKVKEVITMSATAFAIFRQKYPVLSTFARLFKPMNMPIQIEDLDIDLDEAKNQIIVEYIMKGASVNNGDYWLIEIFPAVSEQKVSLVAQNDNVLVFNFISQATQEVRIVTTVTLKLPKKAKNINFDSGTNRISYELSDQGIGGNSSFLLLTGVFIVLGILSRFLLKKKQRSIKYR